MINKPIHDLGAWAEDAFSGLCAAAGVTRNKSVQDRTGWDYQIDFPAVRIANLPADLQPTERTARVQVKSKVRGKPTVSLKLSNALRFAKELTPCFVVLFAATNSSLPVRIYARHFWEDEIAAVLKRGRLAGDAKDLNKKFVSIGFNARDDHTDDLIEWMESTLNRIGDRYSELKAHLVRTVGMDDGSIHGSISFEEADLEALVDHQIGLSAEAPLVNVTIRQSRFGIDAPYPIISGKPNVSLMRSHPIACRVRVRDVSGKDLWLDAQRYAPSIPGLPDALKKVRIVADFLEILLPGVGDGKIDLKIDSQQPMSLARLRNMTTLRLMASQGPLDIQLFDRGRLIFAADAELPNTDEPWLRSLPDALTCLEIVAIDIAPDEFALSFTDIFKAWDDLVHFNGLVRGGDMRIDAVVDRPLADLPEGHSFTLFDYLNIGGWTLMAVATRPIDELKTEGDHLIISCGEPRVVEAMVHRGCGSEFLNDLLLMYERAVGDRAHQLELFGGSYRTMAARLTG